MCGRFVQYQGVSDYLKVLGTDRLIVSPVRGVMAYHPTGEWYPCPQKSPPVGVSVGPV